MRQRNDRPEPRSALPKESRKRFRLERLEERIAPTKGGKGTRNCGGGDSGLSTETSSFVSAY